jgi:CheY-like chemotaxis protein
MRKVLLVDDSPVARHVLARRLAAEGFEVREESAATDAGFAGDGAFACAIIDLELADGDGDSFAAALLRKHASLPIAFFTAGAPAAVRQRARRLGPVFDKPDIEAIVAWTKQAAQPPPTK